MKKHGVVYNRRNLRRGRNITRWVANGCNWQEGRDAWVAKDARLELGSPWFLNQVWIEAEWIMRQLGDYVVTQSVAGAAVRAAQGDVSWCNRLIAMRQGWGLAYCEAAARIDKGESPDLLVHFIDDDPARGLSSGLTPEEHQRGGYISRYYRLGDLASRV